MMRTRWISLIFLLSPVLGSCGVSQAGIEQVPELPPAETATIAETQIISAMPTPFDDMPEDAPLPIPANPGLQALIEKAKADLAQRLSLPASQIKAIETKEVFWPDASLGCPQPGTEYTQVLTSGFLIHLEAGGEVFEYHTDFNEQVILCEAPRTPFSPIKPGDIQDGQPWMPP